MSTDIVLPLHKVCLSYIPCPLTPPTPCSDREAPLLLTPVQPQLPQASPPIELHNTMQLQQGLRRLQSSHKPHPSALAPCKPGRVVVAPRPQHRLDVDNRKSQWGVSAVSGAAPPKLDDPASPPQEPATGDRSHETDFVVIGSGIGGLCCAGNLQLRCAGHLRVAHRGPTLCAPVRGCMRQASACIPSDHSCTKLRLPPNSSAGQVWLQGHCLRVALPCCKAWGCACGRRCPALHVLLYA